MPMPAPTMTTWFRLRAAVLNSPYGPSRATLVPGFSDASWADPLPRLRTVILSVPWPAASNVHGFGGQAERVRMPPQAREPGTAR